MREDNSRGTFDSTDSTLDCTDGSLTHFRAGHPCCAHSPISQSLENAFSFVHNSYAMHPNDQMSDLELNPPCCFNTSGERYLSQTKARGFMIPVVLTT